MQQKKVEYLQKEYQALKDLAGEGSNPALKDLNAYFNKDINPYGYYGIERVGEQLEQAKQKLKEIEELANKVDFSKTIEKAGENFGKDSLKYFLPFSELFNMPEDKIGNLEKTSSTVNIIKTNTNNIKTVMPEVVNNFATLGNTDLSNLLSTTSGIASNLRAIKETGSNININLGFTIKPPEEYNKHK